MVMGGWFLQQTIKNDDLEELRELGSGTYGTVYHGKWRGTDVAIKRIRASCFAGQPSEKERLVSTKQHGNFQSVNSCNVIVIRHRDHLVLRLGGHLKCTYVVYLPNSL
jgi:hypothetical protein